MQCHCGRKAQLRCSRCQTPFCAHACRVEACCHRPPSPLSSIGLDLNDVEKRLKRRVARDKEKPVFSAGTLQERDRYEFFSILTRAFEDEEVTVCDVNKQLFDEGSVRFIDDTGGEEARLGASTSIVFFGTIARRYPVAVKLAFDYATPVLDPSEPGLVFYDNSLATERRIYRSVTSELLNLSITPHVTLYVATLECEMKLFKNARLRQDLVDRAYENGEMFDEWFFSAPREDKKRTDDDKSYFPAYDRWLYEKRLAMLVIERAQGINLFSWLVTSSRDVKNFEASLRVVIFQLVYTLACFQEVGLIHNDLHLGNVWVDERAEDDTLIYKVDSTLSYSVKSRLIAKVNDFDYATKVPTPESSRLEITPEYRNNGLEAKDVCATRGRCARTRNHPHAYMNAYFDAFMLLTGVCELVIRSENAAFYAFMDNAISPAWQSIKFRTTLASPYDLYIPGRGPPTLADTRLNMQEPIEMLRSPYFAPFRIAKVAGIAGSQYTLPSAWGKN